MNLDELVLQSVSPGIKIQSMDELERLGSDNLKKIIDEFKSSEELKRESYNLIGKPYVNDSDEVLTREAYSLLFKEPLSQKNKNKVTTKLTDLMLFGKHQFPILAMYRDYSHFPEGSEIIVYDNETNTFRKTKSSTFKEGRREVPAYSLDNKTTIFGHKVPTLLKPQEFELLEELGTSGKKLWMNSQAREDFPTPQYRKALLEGRLIEL